MSVLILIVPAIVSDWVALAAVIDEVSKELGYDQAAGVEIRPKARETADNSVDIRLENSTMVADAMRRNSEFIVTKGDIRATFRREPDGRCTVHVTGKGRTKQELTTIGRHLVGRVTQRYAYNKVHSELKNRGFTVTHEEVTPDQSIRIRVSKYV